jgi:hypothetical protein
MTTKLTAAQLRGLKVEHEKEIRNNAISNICTIIKDKCIEVAKKGDLKRKIILISNPGDNYLTVSWSKYHNVQVAGILSEDLVADCIQYLNDELIDCIIDGEMEEIPWQKGMTRQRFTVSIDWSDTKPEVPAAPEISELEKLKARVAELEAENSRLKSNPIGAVTQMTTDLLDIFAGFGKIVEKDASTGI